MKKAFLVIFILKSISCYTQNSFQQKIDDLASSLKSATADSAKINILVQAVLLNQEYRKYKDAINYTKQYNATKFGFSWLF
jgi:hypothetical protein